MAREDAALAAPLLQTINHMARTSCFFAHKDRELVMAAVEAAACLLIACNPEIPKAQCTSWARQACLNWVADWRPICNASSTCYTLTGW